MGGMRYRLLGGSGLKVSEVCLGAMTFGQEWGFGAGPEECRRMLEAFRARGGNFIDTANKYTDGSSERIVGELIRDEREKWVLATKYSLPRDPSASGNGRKNLVQSVEHSLRRLGTDYVDLLWVHAWDFTAPCEEVMRGLDDLVRAGKLLYVGVSDAPAWVVARCNTLAELRGWSRFVGLQIEYSLLERTVERELIPMAAALGLHVLAWAPLGGGVLTGKYTRGGGQDTARGPDMNASRLDARSRAIAAALDEAADAVGRSPAQVALAWLQTRKAPVIPIVGARRAGQLEDALGYLDLRLPADELARLDEVSAVPLGFPHDFLQRDYVQQAVWGDTLSRLDLQVPGR